MNARVLPMALAAILFATPAAFARSQDIQAPRGDDRVQAPRGQERIEAPRGDDRVQAPRGDDRVEAPRGDDIQAPRG